MRTKAIFWPGERHVTLPGVRGCVCVCVCGKDRRMIPKDLCPGLQAMLTLGPAVTSMPGTSMVPHLEPKRQRERLPVEAPRPCPNPALPLSAV